MTSDSLMILIVVIAGAACLGVLLAFAMWDRRS